MSGMTQNNTLDFVGEMSRDTGVWVAIGVNAYLQDNDPNPTNVLIDPSSLSDEDESKLEEYAERKGLEVDEEWSDWGRFIKILIPRFVPVPAHSP